MFTWPCKAELRCPHPQYFRLDQGISHSPSSVMLSHCSSVRSATVTEALGVRYIGAIHTQMAEEGLRKALQAEGLAHKSPRCGRAAVSHFTNKVTEA